MREAGGVRTTLVFLGGTLLGGLAGGLGARQAAVEPRSAAVAPSSRGGSSSVPGPAPQVPWDGLLSELAAVREELVLLRQQLSTREPLGRSPVDGSSAGAGSRGLEERMAELVSVLQRATGGLHAAYGAPVRVGPGPVPGLARLLAPPRAATAEDRAAWDELARGYRFLTGQEVLDRLGEPQRITVRDGRLLWTYAGSVAGESRGITVVFYDGIVIDVFQGD